MKDINYYSFKSKKPLTPFAPSWNYNFVKNNIKSKIDCYDFAQKILKWEPQILEKFSSHKNDGYTSLGKDSLTSKHSFYNIFEIKDNSINILIKEVLDLHDEFLQKLKLPLPNKIKLKGWANVLRQGEKIEPHLHSVNPDSYLSGHFTIQCKNTSTFYINPVNQINDPEKIEIKNQVGELTIFPTCLPHYTSIHEDKSERITLAFDIHVV
jgi:hypothetical protein